MKKNKLLIIIIFISIFSVVYLLGKDKSIQEKFEYNLQLKNMQAFSTNIEYYKKWYKMFPDLYAPEYGAYCLLPNAKTLMGSDYQKLCTSCFVGTGSKKEQYKHNPEANSKSLRECCKEPNAKTEMGEIIFNRLCAVEKCGDDSSAASCQMEGSIGHLYEAKEKEITNNNYTCLTAGSSEFDGKSFEVPQFSQNTYCSIYCKEDVDYYYPGHGYNPTSEYTINSGEYFKFKPISIGDQYFENIPKLKQTRSCIYKTDTKRFLTDMYGQGALTNNINGGYYKTAVERLVDIKEAMSRLLDLEHLKLQLLKNTCVVADSNSEKTNVVADVQNELNYSDYLAVNNRGDYNYSKALIAGTAKSVSLEGRVTEKDYLDFLKEFDDTAGNPKYNGPYKTNCPLGSKNDRDSFKPDGHFRPNECCSKLTSFYVVDDKKSCRSWAECLDVQKKYYESMNPGWTYVNNKEMYGQGIVYYKLSSYRKKDGAFSLTYKKRDCIACDYGKGWEEASGSGSTFLVASNKRGAKVSSTACQDLVSQQEKAIEYRYNYLENDEVYCKVMKLTRDCPNNLKNLNSTTSTPQYKRPVELQVGWGGPKIDTTTFDYEDYIGPDPVVIPEITEPIRDPNNENPWATPPTKPPTPPADPLKPTDPTIPGPSDPVKPKPPTSPVKPKPPTSPVKPNPPTDPCPPSHPNYPCRDCDSNVTSEIYEMDVEISELKVFVKETMNVYKDLVEKMNKAKKDYTSCLDFNNKYTEKDLPKIDDFYYDEMDQPGNAEQQELAKKIKLILKNNAESTTSPLKFCEVTKAGYECNGSYKKAKLALLSSNFEDYTDDLETFIERHRKTSEEIVIYDYAENSTTYDTEYGFNLELYSIKPTGVVVAKEKLKNHNNYNYLGFGLPVSLTTPSNSYKYSYNVTNIGENNELMEKYKSIQGNSEFTCLYNVRNVVVCPKTGCETATCTEGTECAANTLAKMKNPEFKAFVRGIDSENLNPNNRDLGINWTSAKGIAAREKINEDGDAIYMKDPLYSFDVNTVKEIKKYNKENKYYDFNLRCNANGEDCLSSFVNRYADSKLLPTSRSTWLTYDEKENKFIYSTSSNIRKEGNR